MNKIADPSEREALARALSHLEVAGALPYEKALAAADLEGASVAGALADGTSPFARAVEEVAQSLERELARR
jgi:CO dehydrogenase nickel-insertion accessory protein CooC1